MTQYDYDTQSRRAVVRERVEELPDPQAAEAPREIYQEQRVGPAGTQVVRSEHVQVPSPAAQSAGRVARAKQVVYFVFGAINVLLLMRFIFLALGASEASPFIQLIYGLSGLFVRPFQGIFGEPALGASVLEWASLIAIAVYSLIAYGIARLIDLIYAPPQALR